MSEGSACAGGQERNGGTDIPLKIDKAQTCNAPSAMACVLAFLCYNSRSSQQGTRNETDDPTSEQRSCYYAATTKGSAEATKEQSTQSQGIEGFEAAAALAGIEAGDEHDCQA